MEQACFYFYVSLSHTASNYIDNLLKQIFEKKKIPIIPLAGVDSNLFNDAKEIGLERSLKKLENLVSMSTNEVPIYAKKEVESSFKTKKTISIIVGPNNVHDILDSFEENH